MGTRSKGGYCDPIIKVWACEHRKEHPFPRSPKVQIIQSRRIQPTKYKRKPRRERRK